MAVLRDPPEWPNSFFSFLRELTLLYELPPYGLWRTLLLPVISGAMVNLILVESPETNWFLVRDQTQSDGKKEQGVSLASLALEPGLGRGSRESAWWLHLRPCLKKQSRPKPPYRVQDYVTGASIVGAGPIGQILQLLKLAIGRKSKSIKNYTNILIISIDHK